MDNLTMHISNFNDRVKGMNQTRQQELKLTATEANNLLSDIFAVLAQVTKMSTQLTSQTTNVTEIVMDGGGFK